MKLKSKLPLRDAIAVTVVGLMVSTIIGQDVFVTPKKGKVGLDETVLETTDMDKAPATDVFLQDGFMRAVSPILRPPSNYKFRKFTGGDTSISTWVDIHTYCGVAMIVLCLVHIGLHWKWIMRTTGGMMPWSGKRKKTAASKGAYAPALEEEAGS